MFCRTLLRQGLYGNKPLFKKVLIVTPSSLTRNWYQEFMRWLGKEYIHVFVVDQKNKPKDFLTQINVPVMIISYEMFVRCYDDVAATQFDLIICDEGHRLKNNSIRASTLLNQLPCSRRVLLSGTPVQNDLQEFYSLVNFVNPTILGTYTEFRHNFEENILASRQPDCDEDVKAMGESKANELSQVTSGFVLRRTHAILDQYLPGKHEYVVFCKPSQLQLKLFQSAISCWEEGEKKVSHLAVITALKKICNHPVLLRDRDTDKENVRFV
ncbi:DNA repair and recombination protein rad54b [Homalodisca vitripennis]|nr:DNA repair and recombination protein rad54b [Homalodisca vitripennis]